MKICAKTSIFMAFFLVLGCASQQSEWEGMEAPAAPEAVKEAVPKTSSHTQKMINELLGRMRALGYQGVAFESETPEMLEFLARVFSNRTVEKRQIRYVYTGIGMAYDPVTQALTVGGLPNARDALNFIENRVPTSARDTAEE